MINQFCSKPLWECSLDLVNVAQGNMKASLVIKNAKLINVCTKEIIDNSCISVIDGRIAYVGNNVDYAIGENTLVIDAKGKYLAPAFMDGHIHIESSMLTVGEYAKAVVPHGTSGVFMDPHEICNVLGLDGVRCMLDDAKRTPLKAMMSTPSCVPAVPGFEDTGSHIGPEEVKVTQEWKECTGLGEMMNFPGVIYANPETHAIIGETLKAGKIVTGHYSMPETDRGLNAYIASGVRCCHESTREIDALSKMRMGMYAMFREGSAWHDLKEVVKSITKHNVDSRFACLISDDTHPKTLMEKGHLDYIVKRAIEEGVDPVTAIQMVTINVATCFHLDHEMGSIAPSKCADFVLIDDLKNCHVTDVFVNGEYVAKNGKMMNEFEEYNYPSWATHSIKLSKKKSSDFVIKANNEEDTVTVRTIEIIPAKVGTFEKFVELKTVNGNIEADSSKDVLKSFVFDRHHENGTYAGGFVKGFGIKEGALAQTVAHDAHNVLVVGSNDEDMAIAVNALIEANGGLVAVKNGKILGKVELPVAGLMSEKDLNQVEKEVENLEKAWIEMGCTLPSPFMTMALIPLACLPELRLTNRGLVDCRTFKFVDLIVKK